MDNSVMMAVAMALVYWLSRGMIGGYFALFFIGNPIFIGIISGLIYGDVKSGLMIGGGIAAVFAGIIAPGGNLPTDQGMAAATMIPIALNTGLSVEQAIAFAVPLGLLGAQLLNLRKIINVPLVHKADEYAERWTQRESLEQQSGIRWRLLSYYCFYLFLSLYCLVKM